MILRTLQILLLCQARVLKKVLEQIQNALTTVTTHSLFVIHMETEYVVIMVTVVTLLL